MHQVTEASHGSMPLALSSSEGLGPLPEAAQTSFVTDSVMRRHEVHSYTAEQMRAYASQQVTAERGALQKKAEMLVLVAVHHTVAACKSASGQHRVIDHFVNKIQICQRSDEGMA